MSETDHATSPNLLALTAQIVSAHVRSNAVPAEALPDLILKVREALAQAGTPQAPEPAVQQQQPAVPIKRSVQPDYLVCLEDGAKVTMLKRYLRRRFELEPDEYRAKWGLPADYPMVAPNYAARRSTLAKELGLGRKRAPAKAVEADEAEEIMAEPVFASDVADEAKAGRHTATSVFANFGAGEQPDVDRDDAADDATPTPAPRKRGRKPFAEQSMRSGRSRRAPTGN